MNNTEKLGLEGTKLGLEGTKHEVSEQYFDHWFCLFCTEQMKCHFISKLCTNVNNLYMFVSKKFQIFYYVLLFFFFFFKLSIACELGCKNASLDTIGI